MKKLIVKENEYIEKDLAKSVKSKIDSYKMELEVDSINLRVEQDLEL